MAEIIKMPRLSDTMEEGKVEAWHKKVGDKIAYGDIIAEIETDKAVQEFEADVDGTLLYIGVQEGEAAPVDEILAIIGEEGEDISALVDGGAEDSAKEDSSTKGTESASEETPSSDEAKKIDPEISENIHVVSMPRLSDTMEEGKVEAWHKKVGDKVAFGDILAEIETDKAVQEFEIDVDGTLLYIGVEEGNAAPVDSILAIIGPEGTDVSSIVESGGQLPENKKEDQSTQIQEKVAQPKSETKSEEPKKSSEKSSQTGRIFISPLAKKLAEDKGYDISDIQGSGDNGRIIKRDVENYEPSVQTQSDSVASTSSATAMPQPTFTAGEDKTIANSQMRKTIAKRLSESKFTAPHYYLNIEVDMENAMAARKQINAIPDTKISFNDIIVKAVAMALRKHPQVNSTWGEKEMTLHGDINIGVAVAVPDGLMVPVVNHADQKSLTQISAEVKDLAGKSRERKIKPEEMQGSTFTVSNLGAYGIESFTSIINQPNSCILSVGAIVEKPVVKNGQIVVGHTMMLSMACDHRTVDGATGSLYLQTLKQYLETPMAMFL
ncbi:pyruvate dehydrogenase [Flavobacteriaceae bacterium Ap0902]|nr:pyruvate dehydrogenase [Flavobacteriaceae bacterium Ap0902]